jgi:hypothetical protein
VKSLGGVVVVVEGTGEEGQKEDVGLERKYVLEVHKKSV